MPTRFEDYAAWPNLVAMMLTKAKEGGSAPVLWTKTGADFVPTSWDQLRDRVLKLAGALKAGGVKPGDRVILLSESRSEWAIADFAIMAAGAITVPAYTTNTERDHSHVLTDSAASFALVPNDKLAARFLRVADTVGLCKNVISFDPLTLDIPPGITVRDLPEVLADSGIPPLSEEDINAIGRSDTACLIYTSGTGGAPKGVMLSHGAILSNCAGAFDICRHVDIGHEIFLSFLPLCHSYEHTVGLMFPISIGAEIYYAQGLDKLAANLAEVRPTIMTAVPRLYEMLYQKINRALEAQGGLKLALFTKTKELGRKNYEGTPLSLIECVINFICEKAVRAKLRMRFGGRLKAFVSGGGPLHYELGLLFVSSGLPILQGYGQTEFAPVASCNVPQNNKLHTVGAPMAGAEVRIAKDGEILLRGESMMTGYWNKPEETAKTIVDGWLHTGDIGHLDEDGMLVITDRKKDIIVNTGGDNISPQKVEGLLTLEPEISQAMVYGDKKPHLVALLVADEETVKQYAGQGDALQKALRDTVDRVNKNLSSIEKVRRFEVAAEGFSIDNEMLTPSMKIRRHMIKAKYGDALEALYL